MAIDPLAIATQGLLVGATGSRFISEATAKLAAVPQAVLAAAPRSTIVVQLDEVQLGAAQEITLTDSPLVVTLEKDPEVTQ